MSHNGKKKKKLFGRILMFLMIAASAGIGAKVAMLQVEMTSAVHRTGKTLSEVPLDASVVFDKDVVNILLIGSDGRASWNDTGRSDTTMIATVDLKNKQLKLTSLMRDMYISIPGHEQNKFNAAYKFGGIELLYQTIATNFNIKLDSYVVIDFSKFQKLIDKLGGVDITLTEKEAYYLNTAYHGKLNVETGAQTLTGKEALAYCRIRQVRTASGARWDYGRTERQRLVLASLFEKFKNQSFNELKDTLIMGLGYVTTDLTDNQIFSLAISILTMSDKQIYQQRIPIDGTYDPQKIVLPGTTTASDVLVTDFAANTLALQNFIFNKVSTQSDANSSQDTSSTEAAVSTIN